MRNKLNQLARESGFGNEGATRREFLLNLPAGMAVVGWVLQASPLARPLARGERQRSLKQLVYAVDDIPELTALYRVLLEDAGYAVRTFNDRAKALQAFQAADPRPSLLITDYLGHPISAEALMGECRRVQPGLKILMSSGCLEGSLSFAGVRPDRFLQKPFAIRQFIAEVKALIGPPNPKEPIPCKGFERRAYLPVL